jgi:hypothetical protein
MPPPSPHDHDWLSLGPRRFATGPHPQHTYVTVLVCADCKLLDVFPHDNWQLVLPTTRAAFAAEADRRGYTLLPELRPHVH